MREIQQMFLQNLRCASLNKVENPELHAAAVTMGAALGTQKMGQIFGFSVISITPAAPPAICQNERILAVLEAFADYVCDCFYYREIDRVLQ
jgi:hypothetical protein